MKSTALLLLSTCLLVGCGTDNSDTAGSGTGGSGTGGSNTGGSNTGGTSTGGTNTGGTGTAGAGGDGGASGASSVGSPPGIHSTMTQGLPGGEPTACEWEWTIRTIHYHPSAIVPRRMYSSACRTSSGTQRMYTSLTVGENAQHPQEDPSSGGIVVSDLDAATGTLHAVDQMHFPECISMHGIATSEDCTTIGVLCRISSGTQGFDKDVLSTHNAADWMTQPYVCGDRGLNDEMWLYEWTDGDIHGTPRKYIVHKAIGSWEYGNNYLRLGDNGTTYGIALKTTVGGENGPDTCHEADAFLVMDRKTETMTERGWSWACGTGHTTFNRPAYNPATNKYALMCSTDYNEAATGGIGAYVFRREDGPAQEFHYMNLDGIKNKGGASALLPTEDGGYIGVLVGTEGQTVPNGYPTEPPTAIGLARWDESGAMLGPIRWVVKDDAGYVSYSTLSSLGSGRFLLGWGVMRRLSEPDGANGEASMRIPWDYYVMEIDAAGEQLTDPVRLDGAGWGELDEMVPLGPGRVGWAYIAEPALTANAEFPSCNQPSLQLSVYVSSHE